MARFGSRLRGGYRAPWQSQPSQGRERRPCWELGVESESSFLPCPHNQVFSVSHHGLHVLEGKFQKQARVRSHPVLSLVLRPHKGPALPFCPASPHCCGPCPAVASFVAQRLSHSLWYQSSCVQEAPVLLSNGPRV